MFSKNEKNNNKKKKKNDVFSLINEENSKKKKKKKKKKKSTTNNVGITQGTKATFEAYTINEALQRAGANPHLKGHIHEYLVKNLHNCNPVNIANGKVAQIVSNPNAKTVDMVVMKGGKVLERFQLKDTPSSLWKTAQQIKSGQYNSAQVLGTQETVDGLSKMGNLGNKTIKSSGVSSKTTEALAHRAGATGSGSLGGAMIQSAKTSGAVGGVVSGGIAAIKGGIDLMNGEKEASEVVGNVTTETIGGAVAGAASGAAATGVGAAIGTTALAGTAAAAAAPIAVAVGVGVAAKYVYDEIAGEAIEEIATDVAEVGSEIAEDVLELGFDALEASLDLSCDVVEETCNIGEEVVEGALDIAEEALDFAGDIVDDVFDFFGF